MACHAGFYLYFAALIAGSCSTTLILDKNWRVKGSFPDIIFDVPATVPGGIYSDLMDNGVIGDVFSDSGDTECRWVGLYEWTYYTNFTVGQEAFRKQSINLVFDGLDTFATVSVNGVQVGTSQNMFLQYVYPVKDVLKLGLNTIEVAFQSPVNVSADLAAKEEYPLPPECPGDEANGECHVNQIRKMQSSFSWDWGPAFPSVGIWKSASIEAFNTAVIRYVTADTKQLRDETWQVSIYVYFDAGTNDRVEGNLSSSLKTNEADLYSNDHVKLTVDDNQELVAWTFFTVQKGTVSLWWPNGYGRQNLYTLNVTFLAEGEESSKQVTIGYRIIELVQDDIGHGSGGKTFYFRVNDVPIFAKGAGKAPTSILPEKSQDPAKITELLEAAAAVNMNMMRVWGGGVYESDFFYAEADRLGIMIWQDMMFAGAYYPAYPEYLDNVKQEIHQQVLRLSHHPCIVLFGGNNENEMMVYADAPGNVTFYRSEYIKLFVDVVEAEIRRLAPTKIYVSSSPANGVADEGDQILTSDPSSSDFGDVHYFEYIDGWDYRNFPVPRFASEFGYQSMPSVDTWLTVTSNTEDLNPDGDFVNHRQHHPDGRTQNTDLINIQLQLPENDNSSDYAATFIYYSQIVQAMSYKTEVEHYRTFAQRLEDGRGYTMGALFWQLNDVWVAPTWSSIDYTGSWKMLHYYARNFYATHLVTAKIDDGGNLNIYVVMDTADDGDYSVEVRLNVQSYSEHEALSTGTYDATASVRDPYKALVVDGGDAADHLIKAGCGADFAEASSNCFFHLTLTYSYDKTTTNFLFPAKLKDSNLLRPIVEITAVTPVDEFFKFDVTLKSDVPAFFVWLDAHDIPGTFNDNGFILITPSYTVTFTSKVETSADELQNVLTLTHL